MQCNSNPCSKVRSKPGYSTIALSSSSPYIIATVLTGNSTNYMNLTHVIPNLMPWCQSPKQDFQLGPSLAQVGPNWGSTGVHMECCLGKVCYLSHNYMNLTHVIPNLMPWCQSPKQDFQLGPTGPNWGPTGAQLGPNWDPTGTQLGPNWGPTGVQLGPNWGPTEAQLGQGMLLIPCPWP